MAWLSVDKDGSECVWTHKPERIYDIWIKQKDNECEYLGDIVELPKGSIKKLIGRELTWKDEPVELKMEKKEYKIGDEFWCGFVKLKCVKAKDYDCSRCFFYQRCNSLIKELIGACDKDFRKDDTWVNFVEVKE